MSSNYKVQLIPIDFPSAHTGDVYPRKIVEEAIERARPNVEAGLLVGSLLTRVMMPNMPEKEEMEITDEEYEIIKLRNAVNYLTCKVSRVSHVVKKFEIDEDALYASITVLDTGAGRQLIQNKNVVKWVAVGEIEVVGGIVRHIDNIVSVDAMIE